MMIDEALRIEFCAGVLRGQEGQWLQARGNLIQRMKALEEGYLQELS
jgi:hypothetical protein